MLKSKHAPAQQPGWAPVHGAAVQEPQWAILVLRLVHVPEQHVGVDVLHFIYSVSLILVSRDVDVRLTAVPHEPQLAVFELKSMQDPEQQPGWTPTQVGALQEPQ